MELNELIDNLTKWVYYNLCYDVELLKPTDKRMSSDYNLVTPKAFALYIPPKDQLPPDIEVQIPSVCLQLLNGEDDMTSEMRNLSFRLSFSTYRPGTFEDVTDDEGNTETVFVKNADGWKDLWLWVSRSLNKLQSDLYIEGVKVDTSTPMKYGHFQIDENLVDAYPMWYAWIELTVTCGISQKTHDYNNYL